MLSTLVLFGTLAALRGCFAQLQLSGVNEYGGTLPEPRVYVPDAGQLDFVYHSHDTMTKFLR